MLPTKKAGTWMTIVLIAFTGLAGIAWNNTAASPLNDTQRDTLPKEKKSNSKSDKTIINGDIDKALDEINRAQQNLQDQLQGKDWQKMQQHLQQQLEKLNAENIQQQVENAIKDLDAQKLHAQAQLSQINWQKMQAELEKAQAELKANLETNKMQATIQQAMEQAHKAMAEMKSVNTEKLQAELEKAQAELKTNLDANKMQATIQQAMEQAQKAMAEMKSVNMEKIRAELDQATQEMKLNQGRMQSDLEKARKSINENLHKNFKEAFRKAQVEMDKAKAELQNYKNMLTEMDKDGLLDMEQPYNIEYDNGTLSINGNIQPATVADKFKHYFKKEKVKLKKTKDGDNDKTIDL